ncbi:septum site-determining protein MinC [Fuchsiella alkaliacetigena]|uniref:septum site-determining protein MinC n=1 Tax=Fuchsiella alkaliacetigena TaxID=957042 RepID=UPI00200B9F7C|nr:septum site-determining protein MinC [Fuchsiella alkaliacetigena]MCK8825603.1 septum site-determining protein MinC [Fuchsiella alkaliacetigena]
MQEDYILFKWEQGHLVIVLAENLDFKEILTRLKAKTRECKNFFVSSKIKINVGRRELTNKNKEQLIDIFSALPGLSVIEIINENINQEVNQEVKKFSDSSELSTLLLNRTLRSGQSIEYGGNVVIRGDVNPGAEVKAKGDILVMGAFRGIAHAGATGSEEAIIAAWRLKPTQLRIGNKIGRAPDEDDHLVEPSKPEIALVKNGAILIKDL